MKSIINWRSHVDGQTVDRSVSQSNNVAPATHLSDTIGQEPETEHVTMTTEED